MRSVLLLTAAASAAAAASFPATIELSSLNGANGFRSSGRTLAEWEAFEDGPMPTSEWHGKPDNEFLFIEWSYVLTNTGLMIFASCITGETVTNRNDDRTWESPCYQPTFVGSIPWDVDDIAAACTAVEAKGRELKDQAWKAKDAVTA